MRIGMNETGAENLFSESIKHLYVNFTQVEPVRFYAIQIGYFVSIAPFSRQNALYDNRKGKIFFQSWPFSTYSARQIPAHVRYMDKVEFLHVSRTLFRIFSLMNKVQLLLKLKLH